MVHSSNTTTGFIRCLAGVFGIDGTDDVPVGLFDRLFAAALSTDMHKKPYIFIQNVRIMCEM